MKDRVREEIYKGYKIAVEYDEDAQSPDDWGNDDAFIVYDHRDFSIERKGFDCQDIFDVMHYEKKKTYKGYWYFPVYDYIHSGVSLSLGRNSYPFNDRWDVSFKGFCLIKREKGYWKEEQAYKLAESLINEWNEYLSGEVYGFNIWELDEDGEELDSIDSCWGYYGDEGMKQLIAECKDTIDYHLKESKN
jgi:hypothetical protein